MIFIFRSIVLLPLLVCSGLLHSNNNLSNDYEKEVPIKIIKAGRAPVSLDAASLKSIFKNTNGFSTKTKLEDYYWIRLDLGATIEESQIDTPFYLRFNTFDYGTLYFNDHGEISQKNIGQFNENGNSHKVRWSNYYSYLEFSPNELVNNRFLFLKVNRATFLEDVKNWKFYFSWFSPNDLVSKKESFNLSFYGFFAGICFIMWLSALSLYFFQRNTEFLYYSVYLIILFIYLAGRPFGIYGSMLNNEFLEFWISESFNFLANMAYCLFLISYLETRKNYPIIHIICVTAFLTNLVILFIIALFYSWDSTLALMYIVKYAIIALNIFGLLGAVYLAFIPKNKLVYFIASATIVLSIGGLLRIFMATPNDGLYLDSMPYMAVGSSIEILIFTFGLNYKANTELRENYRLREETLFSKLKALRAQINPHFIFNALSSIQHLVAKNNNESALKYLTKFSRLTRNVLEASMEDLVLLQDEIKMLQDYLDLESLRFDNTFVYQIHVDEKLDAAAVEIPSMIFQPFVENALLHGLLPKKGGSKILCINFKIDDKTLIAEIDDTGVGRAYAKEGLHSYKKKKSRGLEVTKQRVESLGDIIDPIKIIDKIDDEGRPEGTLVVIKLAL